MKEPSPEQKEQMRDARLAALIRKWVSGKRLPPEDLKSIEHLIPADILAKGPTSPGAKEAIQRATNTRKHAKYPKKLPEYAATYGKDVRTIRRLIRRGKELNDLPPLDDPPIMAAWWRRCMDHQVPDYLLCFAPAGTVPETRAISGDAAGGTTETGEPPGDPPPKPRDFSNIKGLDLEENVIGLRRSHAINKFLLDEALHASPPNDNLTQLRQKNFDRSFELLRKAEITLIEFKKAAGALVDPEPIRTELAQMSEVLRLMHEGMPRKIEAELGKLGWHLNAEQRQQLSVAVEKARADEANIFRNLDALKGPEDVNKQLAA